MNEHVILLVEDNPDDEALMLRALKQNNVYNETIVVRDGVEALDYLFASGQWADRDAKIRPQVVLLDLKLPKLDGLEVLKAMRANPQTRGIPVVVLTSSKEQEDVIASYALGANSFVRKPLDFNQFRESVRQLGIYWLLLNVAPSTYG